MSSRLALLSGAALALVWPAPTLPARSAVAPDTRTEVRRTAPSAPAATKRPRGALSDRRRAAADPTAPLTLVFTGDVALNWRGTAPHLERFPWRDNPLRLLAPLFRQADLAVANMEGVLMRKNPRYAEKRLNLWAPRASAQVFEPAGIDLVSTANNHAFDGRDAGVIETLGHLRAAGVAVMGTGRTEAEARRPYVLSARGSCVAMVPATTKLNLQGHGAAHAAFYPEGRQNRLLALVRKTRRRCPFVVVYIHWGVEKAHRPRRQTRRLAHALVDAGANLVVGHHPHVLQGVERRRGALVAYSLGNLVFSNPTLPPRRTGVLRVQVRLLPAPRIERAELVPLFIHLRRYTPHHATRSQALDLLRRMQSYSLPFGTQVVLRRGGLRFLGPREVLPPGAAAEPGLRP